MRNKKIWIFNGGSSFAGNPKYLFLYINKNRPDIETWWFCYNKKCKNVVSRLGFNAVLFSEKKAETVGGAAGVYVVEQEKEVFQPYLLTDGGIDVLNLWHGVGVKEIGNSITDGFLAERICVKRIKYTEIYRNKELFLVTSPLMEQHFKKQLQLQDSQIVRGGYPRNIVMQYRTYDLDLLKAKKLPDDTKIAVYAPTYRDFNQNCFFSLAIPDFDALVETLERNGWLLIFKLHPLMMADAGFVAALEKYKDNPRLEFWNENLDFYEFMEKIDLAIIDYSSIFYDLIAHGVKKFVRYCFDYNGGGYRNFAFDYFEYTCGIICKDFKALLECFAVENRALCPESELRRICEMFFSYSDGEATFARLVNSMLEFDSGKNVPLPTLYSFDVFDTLIGRTCIDPKAIFLLVQERLRKSPIGFPAQFYGDYINIRSCAESNCREYFASSFLLRKSEKTEISFDMIFERMGDVYGLNDEQCKVLKNLELECEYECSVPIRKNIEKVKALLRNGEKVVLISDMYLSVNFIKRLLSKSDPELAELPLFVSSECGWQKSRKTLFLHVFHSLEWQYGKWRHFGDNEHSDFRIPKTLGIQPELLSCPKMSKDAVSMVGRIGTYDSHLVASLISKFSFDEVAKDSIDETIYSLVSLYFVPYISWVVRHAIQENVRCLYFIARDGYFLKLVADAIISAKNLDIQTKYIYGSRKAWRLSSQVDKIDLDLFSDHGEFAEVYKYEDLVKACHLDENILLEIVPSVRKFKNSALIPRNEMNLIRKTLSCSAHYLSLLLEKAKKERKLAVSYLRQEIDFSQKYAFVEYWGRGYMQQCLERLLHESHPETDGAEFFYCRSIYPSQGKSIRHNFTVNCESIVFLESFFDNIPYESISGYKIQDGKIVPEIKTQVYDYDVYRAFNSILPRFAADFSNLKFEDELSIEKSLFDYALIAFDCNTTMPQIMRNLRHSGGTYCATTMLFAPPITLKAILLHIFGKKFITSNIRISLQNTNICIRFFYELYKNGKTRIKKDLIRAEGFIPRRSRGELRCE